MSRYTKAMGECFWSGITRTFVYIITPISIACTGDGGPTEARELRTRYDTSTIDVESLADNNADRTRVLAMPAGEAAARLGSFEFRGRSYFSFSRGTSELSQADRYQAHIDADGNFRVRVETGASSVETIGVGETIYVRQDKGHMRQKPRRDAGVLDSWGQLAWSSTQAALEPFFGRLRLTKGTAETVANRTTRRYELSLGPTADDEALVKRLPPTPLPVAPPSRWRETSKPLGLTGSLWVDVETGVILKSSLEGRLEIEDRNVRPTQLVLRYDGEVTDPGTASAVSPPADARSEYKRVPRPVDRLSFFREHLPKEEEPGETRTP